jgi:hypothetical protein
MTPDSRSTRRYTDDEIRHLLKRASEIEQQGGLVPARVAGPTLEDLEAIASEAGINPEAVRKAAQELETGSPVVPSIGHRGSGFLGAPLSIELERVVKGEASTDVLESLVPLIQGAAEGLGHPSLMGRTLTWQSEDASKTRVLQISVRTTRSQTRIVVSERYGNLAGGLFGGIIGGVGGGVGLGVGFGVGLGALGSALFATVFPLGIITGSYLIARTAFKSTVQGRMRTLTRLIEDLRRAVEDGMQEEQLRLQDGGESGSHRLGDGS